MDACEKNRRSCVDGNIELPLYLQEFYSGPLIHITSGCVYDGYKDGGWTEDDAPNFTGSFYSACKAFVQPHLRDYVLRIRMPFGRQEHPKNYLTKLRTYPRLIDVRNSLSRIDDVAKVAVWFALNLPPPGIYNVCNPGDTTTREIADMMGLQKEWFTPEEFRASVKAPRSNCTLSTKKLESIYPMPPLSEALSACIRPALYGRQHLAFAGSDPTGYGVE